MSGKNNKITKEKLEKLYINQNKTALEIAKEFNYKSPQTILNKLHKYNIKVKNYKEAQNKYKINIETEWLVNEYIVNNKTITEISKILDCSINTIRRNLINLGIKIKKRYDLSKNNFPHFYGKDNPAWKGGRFQRKDGYVCIWDSEKYMLEHRKVMEKYLGRKLKIKEQIHHINGIKNDNRIENLQITDVHEHIKIHKKRGDL